MRILFVTPTFPPVFGGAETQLFTLARGLVEHGHAVTVLTERYTGSTASETLDGVRVLRVRTSPEEWLQPDVVPWEKRCFGLLEDAEKVLRTDGFDVIQTFCQVGTLVGSMMKAQFGVPLIATMGETVPEADAFGTARSRYFYTSGAVDVFVAGSDEFVAQAERFGAPPERVVMVRFGIDPRLYGTPSEEASARARKWLGVGPDQRVILLVGRFKRRKGILELVQAMPKVLERFPTAVAAVVGSYNSASVDYAEQVDKAIREADLGDNVLVRHGDLPFEQMAGLYGAAEVTVQPSHWEGLGLAALEAVLMGTPLIASRTTGLSEVLGLCPGTVGVYPQAPDELASAISSVLAAPDVSAGQAERARESMLREFSSDSMVKGYLRVYRDAVGG